MVKPRAERPLQVVPDIRPLPKGTRHPVGAGETWISLAQRLGIDPWDLIDFNFPGIKQVMRVDLQRATRQVNWYLSEYVGCQDSNDGGKNYAFSTNLAGRGRGDYRGGVIYLPPSPIPPAPPPPPAPAACTVIQIPPVAALLPWPVQLAASRAGIRWPTSARCLDPSEVTAAQGIYGPSLDYDAIYMSDGVGAQGRPFTVAVPYGGSWIVVLNMGPSAYANPNSDPVTLIHELAHAWQSQHHATPWRFMVNCVESQAAAAAATALDAARSSRAGRIVGALSGAVGAVLTSGPTLGPADAYSYVPGKSFGDYGGEQIAEQIEDFFSPPRSLTAIQRSQIATIVGHARSIAARTRDPENERGLSTVSYEHQSASGVVWHG